MGVKLIINEINADAPDERGEFIELKATEFIGPCETLPTCSLRGYFLVLLKGFNANFSQASVTLFADLSTLNVSKAQPFVVIGDGNIPEIAADMSFSSPYVVSEAKNKRRSNAEAVAKCTRKIGFRRLCVRAYATKRSEAEDDIENGDTIPTAVLLLFEDNDFPSSIQAKYPAHFPFKVGLTFGTEFSFVQQLIYFATTVDKHLLARAAQRTLCPDLNDWCGLYRKCAEHSIDQRRTILREYDLHRYYNIG